VTDVAKQEYMTPAHTIKRSKNGYRRGIYLGWTNCCNLFVALTGEKPNLRV
jgi:hypothetical protein